MNINEEMPYVNILDTYKEEDYFLKSTIEIMYIPNLTYIKNGGSRYLITGVKFKGSNDRKHKSKIIGLAKNCDFFIKKDIESSPKIEYATKGLKNNIYKLDTGTCKLFYVYKNLIQALSGDGLNFNYFRGQSDDYPLLPGALRYKKFTDYIKQFESIYRKLSFEYPDVLDYVPVCESLKIIEREPNLSLLQHYGLKTALLDITKNPYIAMLFMLKDNIFKLNKPTLYLFKIDDTITSKPTLFSEVKKSNTNERIIAQKGAFLNFEKVLDNKMKEKIPYVKLVLTLDIEKYESLCGNGNLYFKYLDVENSQLIKNEDLKDKEKNNDFKIVYYTQHDFLLDSLIGINKELEVKLNEYYYTREDMFPDLENRIRYISKKHNDDNNKLKRLFEKNFTIYLPDKRKGWRLKTSSTRFICKRRPKLPLKY